RLQRTGEERGRGRHRGVRGSTEAARHDPQDVDRRPDARQGGAAADPHRAAAGARAARPAAHRRAGVHGQGRRRAARAGSLGPALLIAGLAASDARGQLQKPITNNNYAIELFQGPLIAPIRVTGVGGAYIALAEDTAGAAVNSASPAVRDAYSTTWFDYDAT